MKRYKRANKLIEDDLKAILGSDASFKTKFIDTHYPGKMRSTRLLPIRVAALSLVVIVLAFSLVLANLFNSLPTSRKIFEGENQVTNDCDLRSINTSTRYIGLVLSNEYNYKLKLTKDTFYNEDLFYTIILKELLGHKNLIINIGVNRDYTLQHDLFYPIEKKQLLGFECLYSERITISNERQEILYEVKAEINTPFEIIQINYNEKAEAGCPNSFQTVIETFLYV